MRYGNYSTVQDGQQDEHGFYPATWAPNMEMLNPASLMHTQNFGAEPLDRYQPQEERTYRHLPGPPPLTHSQSFSTADSECSTGLLGEYEDVSPDSSGPTNRLDQERRLSHTILTPPTNSTVSWDDSRLDLPSHVTTGVTQGLEGNRIDLQGLAVSGRQFVSRSDIQDDADQQNAGTGSYAYANSGIRNDRAPPFPFPTHKQESPPWSEYCVSQNIIQIVPDDITDEDLSSVYHPCFVDTLASRSLNKHGKKSRNHKQPDARRSGRGRTPSASHRQQERPSPTSNTAVSPASSAASGNSRRGRKEGSHLPEEDRKKALGVRLQGSCYRCWKMKETCSTGEPPCENCRRLIATNSFRMWLVPCSFKRLDERREYLTPVALASQTGVQNVRAFLNQQTAEHSQKFILRLSIGFGEPWSFNSIELEYGKAEHYDMLGFKPHKHTPSQMLSPPVVPIWVDPRMMQISVDCWLDKMIGDTRTRWQEHCFPNEEHAWQLRILEAICEHYRVQDSIYQGATASNSFQTLRWALKLLVLNYVMGHAFYVPPSDTQLLFRGLHNTHFKNLPAQERVCPRAANKVVKMMVLPVMRLLAQMTLRSLHDLFRSKEPHAAIWDNAFAAVFLCLVVLNSTQRSLFQRASAANMRQDGSFTMRDAEAEAQTIETELIQHLMGMFHCKFQTQSSRRSYNPLAREGKARVEPVSEFAARVKYLTETCCTLPPLAELEDPGECKFGGVGAERLLAKFILPFVEK